MQGNQRRQHALLAIADGIVIVSVATVAFTLRFGWGQRGELPWWLFAFLPLAWLLVLVAFGAYSLHHLRSGMEEYQRVATASLTLAGCIGIGCYLFNQDLSRAFFVLTFLGGASLLLLLRHGRRRLFNRLRVRGVLNSPVVVVGTPSHIDSISRVLRREKWLGYDIVGALTTSDIPETPGGLPVLGQVEDVTELVRRLPLRAVIFAEGSFQDGQQFKRVAWEMEKLSTEMIVVPAVTDISAGRLATRPVGGLPLVHVERPHALEASRWGKRAFDIVGSSLLLLASAPIVAAAALAIKLEDGGPVFFRQTRVGRMGQEFECFKMRSMVTDAEARKAALESANEGAGVLFKMAKDPRITKVGAFIRRFSVDELPQFLNVLRGDMSLVGPRPALPREVALYDRDTVRRLDVRPGLTGLWQVSGRSDLPWDETVRLDVYYVDNWSMLQDIVIIARTASAVLSSRGAY
ncbi:sugar transferase [Tessaracoccus aquimaris]|uniref:sugar transferase n=1 Tax=Tessaracoccus aquimaris TaxID=1332264 RepID=UPI001D0584D9|nr:sugar transferase [Tessaracoccus aquimaris]